MKEYISPVYEKETAESEDIILASITSDGEGSVGTISGKKGTLSTLFDFIY